LSTRASASLRSEAIFFRESGRRGGLFVQRTYADVSMGDIAEAAGVMPGALYRQLVRKVDLYAVMITADLARKGRATAAAGPPAEACRDLLLVPGLVFLEMPCEVRDVCT
jgi:AcrR family transcriptional regulator